MSQDDLAQALRDAGWQGCDRRTVQRYESGEIRRPQYTARRALVEVLGMPWEHLGFSAPPGQPGGRVDVAANSATEGDDDEVRRRTFALSIAIAGLARATPSDEAEQIRHDLVNAGDAAASVEEWEALRDEYALRIVKLPPALVLPGLVGDLSQLNPALKAAGEGPAGRALARIAAHLTSMTAWTFGNLNRDLDAARWWRTSHQLASRSQDADTRLWVLAQEALMALYQRSIPIQLIRTRIEQAGPLAEALPATAAVAKLHCAQAQAAGMAADTRRAEAALEAVKRTFDALPHAVTADRVSFHGWPSTRIDYTESFTYSHLGNYAKASAAQERALSAFPATAVRDPVKVELQRALCLAMDGAPADAERHALDQLDRLPQPQMDLTIANLTGKVLAALPAGRNCDETRQLLTYVRVPSDAAEPR